MTWTIIMLNTNIERFPNLFLLRYFCSGKNDNSQSPNILKNCHVHLYVYVISSLSIPNTSSPDTPLPWVQCRHNYRVANFVTQTRPTIHFSNDSETDFGQNEF